ncbi:T9SS type A sorting domain-containing protein [Flavobacterium lacus]|uniref:Putative secreted protein (Por secretion system target) n=1 Tax=Flavobacterium lacus TaxID=1353778 RepID=A0A328WK77_9FLAO|nr:T9SS type A sorting domain-containing protein [Flavobacterium lacus]RAR46640.1 putative secreted protein (Por secretion system target) [Flavobacterium lacus]
MKICEKQYIIKLYNQLTVLLVVFFLCSSCLLYAQVPPIEWKVCLGGTGTEAGTFNFALPVLQTSDGGYIAAGNARTNNGIVQGIHSGSLDMWVVKTDSQGNFQWQNCLGSQGSESATSMVQTTDGGYIVAGYTTVSGGDVTGHHGSGDMWIVKLNAVGTISWQKCIGGTGNEIAHSIKQTTDGGYIVAGTADFNQGMVSGHHAPSQTSDMWVVKLDSLGNLVWQKCLGGSGEDIAYSVAQTADGGYIVAGTTETKNNGDVTGNHTYYDVGSASYKASVDYWVVKLDSLGNLVWQKCLGGTGEDIAFSVQPTADGGYIVAGRTDSTNGDVSVSIGNRDAWIVKLNGIGEILWQKSYGGTNNDIANFIQQTTDGGYIIAATTLSNDGDITENKGQSDYWIVKIDSSGTLQWQKTLGGSRVDTAYCVAQTADSGYIVAGVTRSLNGDVVGLHYNVDATDFWLVKFGPDTLSNEEFTKPVVTLYPNPVQDKLQLSTTIKTIKVIDIYGKTLQIFTNVSEISLSHLANGIYLLTLEDENGTTTTQKVVKK